MDHLIRICRDPGTAERDETICEALGRLGGDAATAVDTLTRFLTAPKQSVRLGALGALVRIGEPGLPGLLVAIRSDDPKVRLNAIVALYRRPALAARCRCPGRGLSARPTNPVPPASTVTTMTRSLWP